MKSHRQEPAAFLTPIPNGNHLALAWHSPMSPYSPIKRRVRKRTVRAAERRISTIRITLNLKDLHFLIQSRVRRCLPIYSLSASRAEAQHEPEHQQTTAQQKIPSPAARLLPRGCAELPHLESPSYPKAQPHLTSLLHGAVLCSLFSKHCCSF